MPEGFPPGPRVSGGLTREQALEAIGRRLDRVAELGDPAPVLETAALIETAALASVTDLAVDLAATHAVALVYWFRHPRLAEGRDQAALVIATYLFLVLFAVKPDSVPADLAAFFRENAEELRVPDPESAGVQGRLAMGRYEADAQVDDLLDGVQLFRCALQQTPPEHWGLAMVLTDLARAMALAGRVTGRLELLEEAEQRAREAVTAQEQWFPRLQQPTLLAWILMELYDHVGRYFALTEAEALTATALESSRRDDPEVTDCLSIRSRVLLAQAARTADVRLALQAASAAALGVTMTPAASAARAGCLTSQGLALKAAFSWTGRADLLAELVRVFDEAASCGLRGLDQAAALANLASALGHLARLGGPPTAQEEAVRRAREALALVPDGHPDRPGYQSDLAAVLTEEYQRSGDITTLHNAAELIRLAVAATPADDPHLASRVGNLGVVAQLLSEQGAPDVTALVDEQLATARRARASGSGTPAERAAHQSNLAAALGVAYERTGDLGCLRQAVEEGQGAVQAVDEDDIRKPDYLMVHASALGLLARATGDSGLLLAAADALRLADTLTPPTHWRHGEVKASLANIWHEAFIRSGQTDDLRTAVAYGREAMAASAAAGANGPLIVGNLVQSLRELAVRTGDLDFLAEAIRYAEAALLALPSGHPARARLGLNQAASLRARHFLNPADPAPLREAARLSRQMVAELAADQPDRSALLTDAGYTLVLLGESGDRAAWPEATRYLTEAAHAPTAGARTRITALALLARRPPESGGSAAAAIAALETAIGLLPQAVPRALTRADREFGVRALAGLPGAAAAAAVQAGRPARAVELLEQSRGILVADTIAARSGELARLRHVAPGLAAEFEDASRRLAELEHGGYSGLQPAAYPAAYLSHASAAPRRDRAATDWRAVLDRIRAVPGLQDFLKPKGIEYLSAAAAEGPIVYVYASQSRCDALILTGRPSDPVTLVPLPGLSLAEAERQVQRLTAASAAISDAGTPLAGRSAAHAELAQVLGWTWDVIAEPVLTALGLAPGRAESGRLWWCPVGLLAFLPLHAAGWHTPGDENTMGRSVIERVVSSYTATARALIYARSVRGEARLTRTVIVCASDLDGVAPLPGAREEAAYLQATLPGARLLDQPTRDSVLAALPASGLAHFACHGQADPADPASGRLILRDHATDPLTVDLISDLDLAGAELAYLSACETTVTSLALSDEAVHLTAAFQLAGFPRVVGTMWAANDRVSIRVSRHFYEYLTSGFAAPPRLAWSARALHEAVLRERAAARGALPARWAAYVHFGA